MEEECADSCKSWKDRKSGRLIEGDEIDFVLMESKNILYQWVPGVVLKDTRVRGSTRKLTVTPTEYELRATNPELYNLNPEVQYTVPFHCVRHACNEDFQMLSTHQKREPIGKDETKRVLIIQELIRTEGTYLQGLSDIVLKYYDELFKDNAKRILPEEIKSKILYNDLETFYTLHRRLYITFKRTKSIPGSFLANADWLKMYTVYSNKFEAMSLQIKELSKNKFVKKKWIAIEKLVGMNLESLLITPIQRIPRYELLLRELIKYTSPKHPQRLTLEYAKEKIAEIAKHINSAKDRIEKTRKFMAAIAEIINVPANANLWGNNRFFIKEEEFKRKSTSIYHVVKPCRLMLFTDMLV